MLATLKSCATLAWGLALCTFPLSAAQEPAGLTSYVAYAEATLEKARQAWQNDPNNPQTASAFAQASAFLADLVPAADRRADIATRGIETCRSIIRKHPNHAPAHYFLALNLGQLARTRTLSAFKIIKEMEQAFLKAIELDPAQDYAGPHRALAILYRDAPGWPASIGNSKKARKNLEKAIELAPDYPGNRLAYLTSLLEWGEEKEVAKHLASTQTILQSARGRLTGQAWASSWAEWDLQWETVQVRVPGPAQRFGSSPKPKP